MCTVYVCFLFETKSLIIIVSIVNKGFSNNDIAYVKMNKIFVINFECMKLDYNYSSIEILFVCSPITSCFMLTYVHTNKTLLF